MTPEQMEQDFIFLRSHVERLSRLIDALESSPLLIQAMVEPEPEPDIPRESNAPAQEVLRVLWKARLSIQQRKDEFLFRASEEFSEASTIATDLLGSSPSCQMVGAVIVGIERVARLWN